MSGLANFLFGGASTKSGRNFLFGQDEKLKQIPTMTPQQKQLLNQLLGGLGGQEGGLSQALQQLLLQLGGGSEAEEAFGKQYEKQFQEQTLPRLSEQFAGGAQGGALSSSGFGQALGAAGAGLQTDLAGLRGGQQQNALQQIMQLLGTGLGAQPFAYHQKPASPGFLSQALGSAARAYTGGGF